MGIIVDARRDCRPLDISTEGLAFITPAKFKIGQTVTVNITFGGRRYDGLMTVRSVRKRKDKLPRCGLQASSKNKDLLVSLQTISMSVQRDLLCRLAAIGTPVKQLDGDKSDRTSAVGNGRGSAKPTGNDQADNTPAAKQPGHPEALNKPRRLLNTPLSQDAFALLRLPVSELVDMCVPGELRDRDGRIVVEAGEVVSDDALSELSQSPMYISRDWLKAVGDGVDRTPTEGDERRRNIR